MLLACGSIQELVAGEVGNVKSVAADDPEMNAAIQEAQDTLYVLRDQMSEAERQQFDAELGIIIPESPALP